MICPNCQTKNENRNVFCIACGTILKDTESMVGDTKSPTLSFQFPPQPPVENVPANNVPIDDEETPTVFGKNPANIPPATRIAPPQSSTQPPPTQVFGAVNQSQNASSNQPPKSQVFTPPIIPPISAAAQPKSGSGKKIALLASISLIALSVISVGGYFLVSKLMTKTEVFPQTAGMFVQSKDKDKIDEIKKQDFTNALDGKDKLLKDEGLTKVENNQNLVLYVDEKEFKAADLRLIQLDTIKPDGNLKQIEFQTEAVENKTEVKRVKLPENLANGKYALAVLEGFLDEGKHKFWAFQVVNSDKANNDSILKSSTVSLKSKDKKKNEKTPETPPTAETYVYPKSNGVVLRSDPSLTAAKVDNLTTSDRLYVMKISDNTSVWRGITGYWANVKTDDGTTGWVFAPLLRK